MTHDKSIWQTLHRKPSDQQDVTSENWQCVILTLPRAPKARAKFFGVLAPPGKILGGGAKTTLILGAIESLVFEKQAFI